MIRVNNLPIDVNEHTYLLLSHVSHLEPAFEIAPNQSPLSNTVSMVQIGKMSREELMGVMRAVYAGSKHLEMDNVKVFEGLKKVSFMVDEAEERYRRICIDGDIIIVK